MNVRQKFQALQASAVSSYDHLYEILEEINEPKISFALVVVFGRFWRKRVWSIFFRGLDRARPEFLGCSLMHI